MSTTGMTADDRLDIFDLFARYAWAYDCGDAEAYAETFAPEGILRGRQLNVTGRPAIEEAIHSFFEMRGTSLWQHHNDHLRMVGNDHACEVWSYWMRVERADPDEPCTVGRVGHYFSRCVKIDGRWFFAEREFFQNLTAGLPWKKQARA